MMNLIFIGIAVLAIVILAILIKKLESRSSAAPTPDSEPISEEEWSDLLGRPEDVVGDEDVYDIDPRIVITQP